MLILRIKQAECALADGRLDEAFELAMAGDVRSHRRGQDLAGQVARALAERGRTHLLADRYAEADSDIQKALRLGGNQREVLELRDALAQLMQDRKRTADREAQVLAAARQRVEQGQFSVGQQVLGQVKSPAADELRTQMDRDKSLADTIAEEVERAMSDEDWESALDTLAGVPSNLQPRLREQARKVARTLSPKIREAMRGGRLDLAATMLRRLGACRAEAMELEDLRNILQICHEAYLNVASGRLESAESSARRLACMMPDASWVAEAGDRLKLAREAIAAVVAGPLGLAGASLPETKTPLRGNLGGPAVTQEKRTPLHEGTAGPAVSEDSFLLSVDGVGSVLVLMNERVTIGAMNSSTACDVRLMADAQMPVVTLLRSDEDYLLTTALPVGINDRLETNKVLAEGDKLALSPRCRMVFRRPSAASATAVLDLAGARLPRADVRRIVLMDRELILGPGPNTHVRCDQLDRTVALVQRDGRLMCQVRGPMSVDGREMAGMAEIQAGNRVEVGPVSFVMMKVG